MAIHTVPWRQDPYPPMRAVLRELRDMRVDEAVINLVYPHVKKALREEISKAVQAERDRDGESPVPLPGPGAR